MKRKAGQNTPRFSLESLKNARSREEYIQHIVNAITAFQLEEKKWEAGWHNRLMPFNPCTQHYYRGFNAFWLLHIDHIADYEDNRWLTFAQMKQLEEKLEIEMHIPKGQKATYITVPLFLKDELKAENSGQKMHKPGKTEEPDDDLRTDSDCLDDPDGFFTCPVFNAAQIEGMPPLEESIPITKIERNNFLEKFIASSGIVVLHEPVLECPAYFPEADRIKMPYPGLFDNDDEYYGTKLHEFYHSTGHKKRENRFNREKPTRVDKAAEEVRAEIFSAMAGYLLGLDTCNANAASYVAHYQDRLPASGHSLMRLAAQAGNVLVLLAEYFDGIQPAAKWFPPKKEWKQLIKKQKEMDGNLPGFKRKWK